MSNGEVLARSAAGQTKRERLRSRAGEGASRRYGKRGFRLSWLTFAAGVASLIVVTTVLGDDGNFQGGSALLLVLVLLATIISFLVGAVVTAYRVVGRVLEWRLERERRKDGPQDSVASAVLHSGTLFPLAILVFLWIVFVIVASAVLGSVGFIGSGVGGFVLLLVATHFLNLLNQRVEVKPHEVRLRTMGGRRTLPASSVTNVELVETSLNNPWPRQLVVHRDDGLPVYLRGNFVKDLDRAEQFVEQARQILQLDESSRKPQDGAL